MNTLAVGILVGTFWKRGQSALYIVLLFASSLFFLLYSRIAWEVAALENLLISLLIASTSIVLFATKLRKTPTAIYFAVFTLGTFNHFIFAAAAVSFVVTAGLIASKSINTRTSRLLLMGLFNIPLQIVVMVSKQFILDGPFTTHALPALIAGGLLVFGTTVGFIQIEPLALKIAKMVYAKRPGIPARMHKYLFYAVAGGFLVILPFNGVSFFGMVSGYIVMERVASHIPTLLETVTIYLKTGALIFAFGCMLYRYNKMNYEDPADVLKGFLLTWPIVFLIAMQIETLGLSDRYFILPQAMFFVALALSVSDLSPAGRLLLQAGLAVGLAQAQSFYWHEVRSTSSQRPLDFHYGFYFDTSRHFTKLGGLESYLRQNNFCRVESSSYFISKPIAFVLGTSSCSNEKTVKVEYCITCKLPVAWFSVVPVAPGTL